MPFEPQKEKEITLGPHGYRRCLEADFDWVKSVGGLGSTATAHLGVIVRCMLVGVDEPVEKILEQAHRWLNMAIAENEKPQHYGPDGTESLRWQALAMCEWLLHRRHDAESLTKYVEHKDRFLDRMKLAKNRTEISLSLVGYIDAGALTRVLRLFDGVGGKPPTAPVKATSELQISYVLAKHELEHTYSADDISQATKSFLSRNVDKWLSDGQYLTAAHWLKILHWNNTDRAAKAKDIVMKCYDYLPGRSPPE